MLSTKSVKRMLPGVGSLRFTKSFLYELTNLVLFADSHTNDGCKNSHQQCRSRWGFHRCVQKILWFLDIGSADRKSRQDRFSYSNIYNVPQVLR